MTKRVVLGGIRVGGKVLQLVDEPTGMDAVLTPEHIRLEVTDGQEVTDGRLDMNLAELRRFKEAISHAERVLTARREQALAARNLSLPL
jgi:hypothetical protein